MICLLLKLRCCSLKHSWPWPITAIQFRSFDLLSLKEFQAIWISIFFHYECTWWRLFQRYDVYTKHIIRYICFYIASTFRTTLVSSICWWICLHVIILFALYLFTIWVNDNTVCTVNLCVKGIQGNLKCTLYEQCCPLYTG